MFAATANIMRHAAAAMLSALAMACVLVVCGLALILTLVLASPLKRPGIR